MSQQAESSEAANHATDSRSDRSAQDTAGERGDRASRGPSRSRQASRSTESPDASENQVGPPNPSTPLDVVSVQATGRSSYDPGQLVSFDNWSKLPEELRVKVLAELPASIVRRLMSKDRKCRTLILEWMTTITNDMATKELKRIRGRYSYRGRPFMECFRMWACEKTIHAALSHTSNSVRIFVQEYCRQNGDLHYDVKNTHLVVLAHALARLHRHVHAPAHLRSTNIPSVHEAQVTEHSTTVVEQDDFPSYSMIESPDNYCTDVKSDPDTLGEVTADRNATRTAGLYRLTFLLLEDLHGLPRFRQPFWTTIGGPVLPVPHMLSAPEFVELT